MKSPVPDTVPVAMLLRGDLRSGSGDYAWDKISALIRRLSRPVLYARVRLTRLPGRAVPRPVLAQAILDLNGRPVRAHAAGATEREAVDLLVDRLRHRSAVRVRHCAARRGGRRSTAAAAAVATTTMPPARAATGGVSPADPAPGDPNGAIRDEPVGQDATVG
jgi:hypothetical protein